MTVALCANKVRTEKILRSHGIPVPGRSRAGKRVIKPVRGCGAQGVRISDAVPGQGEFAQQYIEGEHFSVSIVANRIIGDACLYFYRQTPACPCSKPAGIETGSDGAFHYLGGETPVHPAREAEIIEIAKKTALKSSAARDTVVWIWLLPIKSMSWMSTRG